ncbi:MAG: metallophosphoesterase [Agathobacter sp.]|nr:metallophosphoesterase [Agathobacter sp.]
MANNTYVVSDLHGNYDGFMRVLEKIKFTDSDTLYVDGDVIDRGRDGIKILRYMMMQPNIYPILGNHEYMACMCLKFLMQEISVESIVNLNPGIVEGLLEWQNVGGQQTIDEFHRLSMEDRQDIIDYLEEFTLFEEVHVGGQDFVIVHAGLTNFDRSRRLEDYGIHELIFNPPDYNTVYFPDKFLVTGHLPTRAIEGAKPDCIMMWNHHIAIDCGSGYDGRIGCICLNTMEEFYSK